MDSKVSVCMAVYNGAAFVKPQIDSILVQIGVRDELIVVDDASEDCSQSILQSITDPRLHVYRNPRNVGVLATFEKALMLATGEIVFLSDQDDIWLPGKVEKVLNVFTSLPSVTMVATDAMVVDGQGRTISESFFSMRGCFSAGAFHNFV